ncbi:MAG: NAD(P)/FAD-dependent oxidoreductase [Candidatus Omnitrophica bacterium]|nr:NAD(P)/FAD-dependent oxidoreductase [Candidatus Omnitrophota bacterium]
MNYVIIGNCAAGLNALEAIRAQDKKGQITVISDESYPVYGRCLISYYLAGLKQKKDLFLRPGDFYERMKANTLLGKKAIRLLPEKKKVILENKQEVVFDTLLLATGGYPKPLGLPGEKKPGVYTFRTLDDAEALLKLSKTAKRALVLGGGLVGLKAAYGLAKQGLDVEVIVKSKALMSQVIDEKAALILRRHLEKNGILIHTGLAAKEIVGKDKVESVVLDDGQERVCDIVVVGKGVAANTDWLKDSGIKTHWGVLTNEHLETNLKGIFAAGDCAETYDVALGQTTINALWSAASLQGRIAGLNMAGKKTSYDGSLAENSVEFFGLPVVSLGIHRIPEEGKAGFDEIAVNDPENSTYKRAVIKDKKLVGFIRVGRFTNAGVYLSLIKEKIDISKIKDLLLEDWFGYAQVKDLIPEKEKTFSMSVSIEGRLV